MAGVPRLIDVSIAPQLITLYRVDASAVRAADRHVLVGYAAAIAGNARDLLTDAELLLNAGRWAPAHSLAAVTLAEALFGSWAGAQDVIGDADAAADLLASRPNQSPATPTELPEA